MLKLFIIHNALFNGTLSRKYSGGKALASASWRQFAAKRVELIYFLLTPKYNAWRMTTTTRIKSETRLFRLFPPSRRFLSDKKLTVAPDAPLPCFMRLFLHPTFACKKIFWNVNLSWLHYAIKQFKQWNMAVLYVGTNEGAFFFAEPRKNWTFRLPRTDGKGTILMKQTPPVFVGCCRGRHPRFRLHFSGG